jgi:hypothetical protein
MSSDDNNENHKLGAFSAIANAFFNCEISFYPRFKDEAGEIEKYESSEMMSEIAQELGSLKAGTDARLDSMLQRTRESLDEVKSQTEYQDQKATRIVTIVAFLTAISGVLFSRFVDAFPFAASASQFGCIKMIAVLLTYLLFVLFVSSAMSGALVVFHATRTRFVFPSLERAGAVPRTSPRSFLFYSGIIELRPGIWARSFTIDCDQQPPSGAQASQINRSLDLDYLKNQIAETYLVAVKTADKLRYLEPAQNILSFAVRVLIVWILFFSVTMMMDLPTASSSVNKVGEGVGAKATSEAERIQNPSLTIDSSAVVSKPDASDVGAAATHDKQDQRSDIPRRQVSSTPAREESAPAPQAPEGERANPSERAREMPK